MGTGMMRREQHEEIKALIAPYVLGAVTPEQAARVRAHLLSCEECMAEADGYAEASASLALAVEPQPIPEGFADRVMAAAAEERPSRAASAPAARRPWSARVLVSYAALLLVIAVLAVSLVAVQRQESREQDIVEALRRRDGMVLEGPGGAVGKMVPTTEGGTFVAAGLRSAPEGHTYQVWLIEDCRPEPCDPVSAGTFDVSGSLGVLETEGSLGDVDSVAVTIEREGGADQPTSDPVLQSVS